MLNQRYAEASVEVLDILSNMNLEDISKIPKSFLKFLNKNASKDYICNLDYSKELKNMGLKQETKELLAVIYKLYLCPEEKKESLQNILVENEQKYQRELMEKYNPDNMFQKDNNEIIDKSDDNIQIVKYKESFIQKFLCKIKSFFRK